MYAAGDAFQPFLTMVNGVKGGHDGHQCGRGANIGGCFFAFDVLFTHLQGHAVGGLSVDIFRQTDDTTRQLTFVGVFCGKKSSVGATESHGNAEALG